MNYWFQISIYMISVGLHLLLAWQLPVWKECVPCYNYVDTKFSRIAVSWNWRVSSSLNVQLLLQLHKLQPYQRSWLFT